jgi:endo-1,4-beta-xylanase
MEYISNLIKQFLIFSRSRLRLASVFIVIIGVVLVYSQFLADGHRQITGVRQPALKVLAAKHGLELGNFAIYTHIYEKPYSSILTNQFSLALVDNTPNWYFTDGGLRPTASTYNFGQMDKVVKFAVDNNMKIQAHHLVWGDEKWLPVWLKNGQYTKSQLLQIIHDHIYSVVGRYKGQIQEWSVVNEAFTRAQHLYSLHDWWADHIGSQSYIDNAYIWARQSDPKAILILNDFNDEIYSPTSNNMYSYIKSAKQRGIPIDGIGMQMHIDASIRPSKAEVISNMQRFGKLGVKVYVTEFDVNMSSVSGSSSYKNQLQAAIYYDMVRACIESRVCPSFSILGITDKETWYNYMDVKNADPLPFDDKYKPKPAYYGLFDGLQKQ